MSRRKDRDRAEAGNVIRNEGWIGRNFDSKEKEEMWACFSCGASINKAESTSLEGYVRRKPKGIVEKEVGRFRNLLEGKDEKTSRVCKKCYKEKIESGS